MKKLIFIISIVLLSSCGPSKQELENLQYINKFDADSLSNIRITKLETQVKALTRANDSIAWEFEHYRYWLWKEHSLTEHDYWNEDYSFSICGPPAPNPELQKRTKRPSKDKNELY